MENNRVTFSLPPPPPPPRSTPTNFKDGANLLFRGLRIANFKDGANLLFRGLRIANTNASSMSSWVSYRFQIDSSYTFGRAKTMQKCLEWTRIFFWKQREKVAFSNEYGFLWTGPKSHSLIHEPRKRQIPKLSRAKLLDNTTNSKGLITWARKAMRINSVLSAVLFLAWFIPWAARQAWLLLKLPPGNPTSQYRDFN